MATYCFMQLKGVFTKIAKSWIEKGYDLNMKDKSGNTALDKAISMKRTKIVEMAEEAIVRWYIFQIL